MTFLKLIRNLKFSHNQEITWPKLFFEPQPAASRKLSTMSSSSDKSRLEIRTISGKNSFFRVAWIKATHAARRCQRSGDFAHRKTCEWDWQESLRQSSNAP